MSLLRVLPVEPAMTIDSQPLPPLEPVDAVCTGLRSTVSVSEAGPDVRIH